jgi:hypothetical protein
MGRAERQASPSSSYSFSRRRSRHRCRDRPPPRRHVPAPATCPFRGIGPSTLANVSGTAREKSRPPICDFFSKKTKATWTISCAQLAGGIRACTLNCMRQCPLSESGHYSDIAECPLLAFWHYHRGADSEGHQSKCCVRQTGPTFARPYFGAITTNAGSAESRAALPRQTCITFSRVQPEERTSRRTWSLCATAATLPIIQTSQDD